MQMQNLIFESAIKQFGHARTEIIIGDKVLYILSNHTSKIRGDDLPASPLTPNIKVQLLQIERTTSTVVHCKLLLEFDLDTPTGEGRRVHPSDERFEKDSEIFLSTIAKSFPVRAETEKQFWSCE